MIQDIFVYEAFKGFEVRFYLAIVVEGEHDVVVVFPVSCSFHTLHVHVHTANCSQSILPRRRVLEEVWRGAKSCLYEPKS